MYLEVSLHQGAEKGHIVAHCYSAGLGQCEHTIRYFIPLRTASASITASTGGGSTAFARNGPIPPSLSNLMDRASSCSGVRNISGVVC